MRHQEHFQREVDARRSQQLSERDVLPVLWPVCQGIGVGVHENQDGE